MSLQQMLQKLTDQIYCTKALDSNQNNSKCVTMLCTKKFRQINCTYNCYKVLFEKTYNKLWITTVFQISNIIYHTSVSLSTEKIQFDICQYSFRFQSRLSTFKQQIKQKITCTQTIISYMIHSPQDDIRQTVFYFFTIHMFCIVLFHRQIFNYVLT